MRIHPFQIAAGAKLQQQLNLYDPNTMEQLTTHTAKPIVSIIVAISRDNIIAVNGAIPWKHRTDMEHFHNTTYGKPIIMGRKTFDSIGKPLPGRKNIVLSRSQTHSHPGVFYATSPEHAIEIAGNVPEVIVIGGAEIYSMFALVTTRMYISVMDVHISERAQDGEGILVSTDSSDDSSDETPTYTYTYFDYGVITDAFAWTVTTQKTFGRNTVNDYNCMMTQYDRVR